MIVKQGTNRYFSKSVSLGNENLPLDIGNFASGTDSMDFDAEIEKHERQLEQTLLEQLKIAKSVAEAKQF
jgi:hypothetical protein